MNCEEAKKRVSDALDRKLSPGEEQEFRAHLEGCANCSNSYRELEETVSLIGSIEQEDPPPGFSDRVLSTIAEEEVNLQRKRFRRISLGAIGSVAAVFLLFVLFDPFSLRDESQFSDLDEVGVASAPKARIVDHAQEPEDSLKRSGKLNEIAARLEEKEEEHSNRESSTLTGGKGGEKYRGRSEISENQEPLLFSGSTGEKLAKADSRIVEKNISQPGGAKTKKAYEKIRDVLSKKEISKESNETLDRAKQKVFEEDLGYYQRERRAGEPAQTWEDEKQGQMAQRRNDFAGVKPRIFLVKASKQEEINKFLSSLPRTTLLPSPKSAAPAKPSASKSSPEVGIPIKDYQGWKSLGIENFEKIPGTSRVLHFSVSAKQAEALVKRWQSLSGIEIEEKPASHLLYYPSADKEKPVSLFLARKFGVVKPSQERKDSVDEFSPDMETASEAKDGERKQDKDLTEVGIIIFLLEPPKEQK